MYFDLNLEILKSKAESTVFDLKGVFPQEDVDARL